MADHDGFNLYNQFEYEPYQQYPSEDERITEDGKYFESVHARY